MGDALYSVCTGSRDSATHASFRMSGVGPGVDSHEKGTEPPPQLRRAARLTVPHAPVARAWRANLGHARVRRGSDPGPNYAAQ